MKTGFNFKDPKTYPGLGILLLTASMATLLFLAKMDWIEPTPQPTAMVSSALHSAGSNLGWTKGNAKQYAEPNIDHEFCIMLGDIINGLNSIRRDIERIERQGVDATREKRQFNQLLTTFNKVPECKNCNYSLSRIEPYKLE